MKKSSNKSALKVNVVSMPRSDGPSKYVAPEERKSGPFDDYEVREALRTLTAANKIRKNGSLMRAIKAEARRQLQAAESTSKALSGA